METELKKLQSLAADARRVMRHMDLDKMRRDAAALMKHRDTWLKATRDRAQDHRLLPFGAPMFLGREPKEITVNIVLREPPRPRLLPPIE